jgi:hypothetical protein
MIQIMQKEAPSVKISAYCTEANKKVTYILSVEEGLSLKCKKCGRSAIIASPNYVYCGVCHRYIYEHDVRVCSRCDSYDIEWYDGLFYKGYRCRKCDSHDFYYEYYLHCDNCYIDITRRSHNRIKPIDISKSYYCGGCGEKLELGEKVSMILALCTYCGRKRYCVGEKIMDVFSTFCKSCFDPITHLPGCMTDWIETDMTVMCLSCGSVLGK